MLASKDLIEEIFPIIGTPPYTNLLFLGNYVNRGPHALEIVTLLFSLKLRYPRQIHLLRGNHEARQITQVYGFYDQLIGLYGNNGVWRTIMDVFDCLPLAATISGTIFAVHSGLSPYFDTRDEIGTLDRFQEVPAEGPICDLLWNDPDERPGWSVNRGAGYGFGEDITTQWNFRNNFNYTIRSHQLVMEGCSWMHNNQLCSVFSSPNYCNRCGNKGAVVFIGEFLEHEVAYFDAVPQESLVRKRVEFR